MQQWRNQRTDSGSTVVLTLLWMPVLLLCAGLAADFGHIFAVRYMLWTAADQGALAGARQVDLQALAEGEVRLDQSRAAGVAREVAIENAQASLGGSAPVWLEVETTNAEVEVAAEVESRTYFLSFVLPEVAIRVRARAGVVRRKTVEMGKATGRNPASGYPELTDNSSREQAPTSAAQPR